MTRLSVNINKVATLRNARGGNNPDVLQVALDCEAFGAQGITVHPRPDGRHIRYADVYALKPALRTEFNIEGNPSRDFMDLVLAVCPTQVTLVPDEPGQLTSDAGWDTRANLSFLSDVVTECRRKGIRTSIFVGTEPETIEYAARTGAHAAGGLEKCAVAAQTDGQVGFERLVFDEAAWSSGESQGTGHIFMEVSVDEQFGSVAVQCGQQGTECLRLPGLVLVAEEGDAEGARRECLHE